MTHRFFKIVTPIRVLFVITLASAVLAFLSIRTQAAKQTMSPQAPNLDGLVLIFLCVVAVVYLLIDATLSAVFSKKPKANWMIQLWCCLLLVPFTCWWLPGVVRYLSENLC